MSKVEKHQIKRGDIFFANLASTVGSEQQGTHPVLVIQNDVGNRYGPTVIVAAIAGCLKGKRQPTHVRLQGAACGLFRNSTVLLEQLRTLDCSWLGAYMGSVGDDKMQEVDKALCVSLGLPNT